MHKRLLRSLGKTALACLWIFAAIAKTKSLDELSSMFKVFFPGINQFAAYPAVMLVVGELAVGVMLLIPRLSELALRLSACAGIAFLGVNLVRWTTHMRIPCSCFGEIYREGPIPMILLDLAVILASLASMRPDNEEI